MFALIAAFAMILPTCRVRWLDGDHRQRPCTWFSVVCAMTMDLAVGNDPFWFSISLVVFQTNCGVSRLPGTVRISIGCEYLALLHND